ncbi:hypothetical protein NRIC_05730 [Enterococcus florum]|uniref:Uncharacterized protein n=1 Tax=Enterococcus florum TaxID=2480627 RepID=A0A4P5PB65_9ENTE|nr:hypothetical protein [Enterococcus florum]GCF92682.1 hypothetical protein NRIC_05730 [Enterococcus florum]
MHAETALYFGLFNYLLLYLLLGIVAVSLLKIVKLLKDILKELKERHLSD